MRLLYLINRSLALLSINLDQNHNLKSISEKIVRVDLHHQNENDLSLTIDENDSLLKRPRLIHLTIPSLFKNQRLLKMNLLRCQEI